MTLDELRGLVVRFYSPEELTTFDKTIDLFERFEVEEYLEQLDLVLGQYYTRTEQEAIDALKATMLAMSRSMVEWHSIRVNEDATQSQINDVLDVLNKLPNWEARETLVEIAKHDLSAEDRFVEMMVEVLGQDAEAYDAVIEYVHPELFNRLQEDLTGDEEAAIGETTVARIHHYVEFRSQIKVESLWADRYIYSDGIGENSFETLLPLLLSERKDIIDAASTAVEYEVVALELIALACASSDGIGQALNLVQAHQGELYRDVPRAMALDSAMTKVFLSIKHE